jgi:hypothetical protein
MATQDTLQKYFKAIHGGGWEDYVAEDFTFINSNLDNVLHGKQAYVEGAGRFFRGTTDAEIKQLFIEGNRAAVLARYTLRSPKGNVGHCDVAEFLVFENDKLTESTIIFDLKAFNEFMQS